MPPLGELEKYVWPKYTRWWQPLREAQPMVVGPPGPKNSGPHNVEVLGPPNLGPMDLNAVRPPDLGPRYMDVLRPPDSGPLDLDDKSNSLFQHYETSKPIKILVNRLN